MNILYWNTNKNNVEDILIDLLVENEIDLGIISEANLKSSSLLKKINKISPIKYTIPPGPQNDPFYIIRFPSRYFKIIYDDEHISIRSIKLPIYEVFTLVAVHLPSKLHYNDDDQAQISARIISQIIKTEDKEGHHRTIIIGDFNMNPFESGMVGSEGFHALMDKNIVNNKSRIVLGCEKYFFYNPMWHFLGNFSENILGTYFYNSAKPINYYWNIFDQVLLRYDLLNSFDPKKVKIITSSSNHNLLNDNGIPNKNIASDHLPININLELKEVQL